jgi:hypothetical protein
MPETVAQPVVTQPVVPEHNPYAPYGLDAQGNPLTQPKVEAVKPDPIAEKVTQLESKLAAAEAKIGEAKGNEAKFEILDKLAKAFSGEGNKTDPAQYKAIFEDLKKISPPGVRKALELLEQDPQALEKLTGDLQGLQVDKLVGVNIRAHERVLELAKKAGFKGTDGTEMNKMVFPFERAITEVVNANPELKKAFLSGNVDVIDEVFNSLVSPHIAQRLRDKQTRMQRGNVTKTPPFGKAQPQATQDSQTTAKPDLRTPKGRAEFHKQATARFFDKQAARDEE